MNIPSVPAPRSPFYVVLALAFLGIALAGFSTTFFFPLARGTFTAPPVVYVHGVLVFGWLLLFIAQAALIRSRRLPIHRFAGGVGAALAVGIVVSGVGVGTFATHRDLAATGAVWPYGQFVNILIEMLVFGGFVAAAVAMRDRPETHKRLLILATISALGPAWFRFRHFMPYVPNPVVAFSLVADSVLLVVVARDWWVPRRVHPAYVWGGAAMVAVHAVELTVAESALWESLGRRLLPGAGP